VAWYFHMPTWQEWGGKSKILNRMKVTKVAFFTSLGLPGCL
jgi:hypothetical protein